MAEKGREGPTTGTESDISKAQSQQQPPNQASQQQPETGEQRGEFETERAESDQPDEGLQGDTVAQQRTDVEGGSLATGEKGEAESGFVGSQGEKDSSSELVDEDNEKFGKDGQGAPEGK